MDFRGTAEHALDAKNRLTIPARYREAFAGGLVLAMGLEGSVEIWRPDDFRAYIDSSMTGQHPLSRQTRQMIHFFSANSQDTELDSAGRVGVPRPLLDHAALDKQVLVTGAGDYLAVWNPDRWREFNAGLLQRMAELSERLDDAVA